MNDKPYHYKLKTLVPAEQPPEHVPPRGHDWYYYRVEVINPATVVPDEEPDGGDPCTSCEGYLAAESWDAAQNRISAVVRLINARRDVGRLRVPSFLSYHE